MKRCECEHVKHVSGCPHEPSTRVYTDYGWYNVCIYCAISCLKATQSASGIWKQGDIYRG